MTIKHMKMEHIFNTAVYFNCNSENGNCPTYACTECPRRKGQYSKQKIVYMYICRIMNGFRDTAISLSSKIVDNKEILRTVSNTGIYCSSDKVGTVYLVKKKR
jgi:hypothetical protein